MFARAILIIALVLPAAALAQDSKENADFKLAVNLYNDKLYDLALEQFRQFVNLYPNTQQGVEARFYLGLTEAKLGKYDDARFTFQNFALAYPEHPRAAEAWMNAAEAYVALKNFRDAAVAYERVKTFQPKSKSAPSALLKAADYYQRMGDDDNARRVLRMLTQEYSTPEVLAARLRLAELLIAGKDFEPARQECRRVAEGTKDAALRARALFLMGNALTGLDRISEAETALSQVVTDYRSSDVEPSALFLLGTIRYSLGNTVDAMASWRAVADDSVRSPRQLRQDAFLEMGDANARVNRPTRALELYERAASIRGARNGEALFKAGIAAEGKRDTIRAALFYQRALGDSAGKLDPRAVMIGAFRAARWNRNAAEALRIAEDYRKRSPEDRFAPRLLFEAGMAALEELSDATIASSKFDDLLTNYPMSPLADDALYARSLADRRLLNPSAALQRLERLLHLYPASAYADRARRDIEWIRAFEMTDRQMGLQKLALLIGDVIAGKPKGSLAFRLAEISFHDLNDYALAAKQYQTALESDLDDGERPTAWFYRARSLQLVAMRSSAPEFASFRSAALEAYDSLMQLFPASPLSGAARSASLELRISAGLSPDALQVLGDSLMRKPASFQNPGPLLVAAGDALVRADRSEAAARLYRTAVDQGRDREVAANALYGLASCMLRQGARDSAVALLGQYAAQYPDSRHASDALHILAAEARDSGEVEKADAYIGLLTRQYYYTQDDRSPAADRARARYEAGAFGQAADFYALALEQIRSDYFAPVQSDDIEGDFIFQLASCYEKAGNRPLARRWYSEYVARDQASARAAQAYYALANFARADNAVDLAEQYLRDAGRISAATGTSIGNMTLETADLLFQNEKYAEAITKYAEVAQQAKSDSLRRYAQARIILSYYRSDGVAEADKRAIQFVKTYPKAYDEAAEFEFERGRFALRKEDLLRARQRFTNVAKSYPKSPAVPEALYWLARSYELDQQFPDAVKLYDSILTVFPDSPVIPRVRLSLGNALYNLEQWDAASKQYRAILDHEDQAPDLVKYAMSNLIMTYKEMEMYDAALELTRKYLDRYPNEPDLMDKRVDIGVLYEKLGYYDQAIVHLQSLLESAAPELEAELRYYIGEARYNRGEYQQAILEFLKVPYLVTKRGKVDWVSTSYYMAGQSYEKMSKYDQAIVMYKQIVGGKDTDTQFKVAAQKEIDRVKTILGKKE